MSVTPEQILGELERLNHQGRVRRMIELGRQAADTGPDSSSIIASIKALEAGDFFWRFMALQTCCGSRDAAMPYVQFRTPRKKSEVWQSL